MVKPLTSSKNFLNILNSKSIKWNFTKFLMNSNGEVVNRFAPITTPEKISTAIEKIL